jgi:hypothetical protein
MTRPLPRHSKITHLLDLLRSDAAPPKAVALPSLDEWIESEGMDPEGWSEAELLAEYKAHFGLDNVDAIEAAAELQGPCGGAGEGAQLPGDCPLSHATSH